MSVFVVPQAIMSLIPILKRPPVSGSPVEYVLSHPEAWLTVVDHGDVFLLSRTDQRISPIELKALTTMQTQKFIWAVIGFIHRLIGGTEIGEKHACDELL